MQAAAHRTYIRFGVKRNAVENNAGNDTDVFVTLLDVICWKVLFAVSSEIIITEGALCLTLY